jgi:hypothetical protein
MEDLAGGRILIGGEQEGDEEAAVFGLSERCLEELGERVGIGLRGEGALDPGQLPKGSALEHGVPKCLAGGKVVSEVALRNAGRLRKRVTRDGKSHRVGSIGRHLAVKGDAVVYGRIGRHDGVVSGHGCTVLRGDPHPASSPLRVLFDGCDRTVGKQLTALFLDRVSEDLQVGERVESRLVGVAQDRCIFEPLQPSAHAFLDCGSGLAGGFVFGLRVLE